MGSVWDTPLGRATLAHIRAAEDAKRAAAPRRRSFVGAEQSRLTNGWTSSPAHINRELYSGLRTLRARSRELAINNEYARKFLGLVRNNVVGSAGFNLQVQAKTPDGRIDQADSRVCEEMFADWSKAGNCEVSGQLSFVELQHVYITTIARDGEVLVRRHPRGPYSYQLELIDPQLLDERLNVDLPNGNKVRMGVEYDRWHAPVAYHMLVADSSDPRQWGYFAGNDYERVPANQIWHRFVPEMVGQLRGVPWMSAAMFRLQMLAGYEEAAMVAARLGAAQAGGFFETPDGEGGTLADTQEGEPGTGSEQLIMDVEPGVYRTLPPGVKPHQIEAQYPHAMFADFVKMSLRGAASGMLVGYYTLGNDLEGVNFSSIRQGELDVRETWKHLQGWMVNTFLGPLYSEVLPAAILSGRLKLPFEKLRKFDAALWQGRRWDWVDPQKDWDANISAITHGLKSPSQVIREAGRDPDEVWNEWEADKARLAKLGIVLQPKQSAPAPAQAQPQQQSNGE